MNQKRKFPILAWLGLVASVLMVLGTLWVNVETARGMLADLAEQGWLTTVYAVIDGLFMTISPVLCMLFYELTRPTLGEK